eukprot:TRINITY_DN17522_c0_g1_i1.p1 TRINITY_DN17522_c0_g1~~TRINITY_DN17522_c0_g1_i1.p1  ORF type:complete len:1042 (-),score=168.79 TRINITY_DN17522_c0_g1_i1:75-3200(-)
MAREYFLIFSLLLLGCATASSIDPTAGEAECSSATAVTESASLLQQRQQQLTTRPIEASEEEPDGTDPLLDDDGRQGHRQQHGHHRQHHGHRKYRRKYARAEGSNSSADDDDYSDYFDDVVSSLKTFENYFCPKNKGQFANLLKLDADKFLLNLTSSFKKKNSKLSVLITAVSTKGSYIDSGNSVLNPLGGYQATLASQAEAVATSMFEFKVDRARKRLDVYKPLSDMRTSDKQSKKATKLGLGDAWIDSIPLLQQDPCGEDNPVIIDLSLLIASGFWVQPGVAAAVGSFRVNRAKAYKKNVDVTVEYLLPTGSSELGFSILALPEEPMKPRANDDRLLYLSTDYTDLGVHKHKKDISPSHATDTAVSMINKYDLKRLKTIKFYVDPSVPKRWRKAFKEGIEGWNAAFDSFQSDTKAVEAALGYKTKSIKAILPDDDDWPEDYDMSDARFNTVSWDLNSAILSVAQPRVDPRSGEVVKADIAMSDKWVAAWLANLDVELTNVTHEAKPQKLNLLETDATRPSLELLAAKVGGNTGRKILALQLGKNELTEKELEELVSSGLKHVVMHETGHTLGLRHNFKGSMAISWDCLQNRTCTQKHGLSSSVMDYVPMNLPSKEGTWVDVFSPGVGAYDKLAIQYGYMSIPKDESEWPLPGKKLQGVLTKAEAIQVCYDGDSMELEDPYCRPYDMSSDPVRYWEEQFSRFVKVQQHLLEMSVAPGESYKNYGKAVREILGMTMRMATELFPFIGGIRHRYDHRKGNGTASKAPREPVELSVQKRALKLLFKISKPVEAGLVPPAETMPFLVEGSHRDMGEVDSVDFAAKAKLLTRGVISKVLNKFRLLKVHRQENIFGSSVHSAQTLTMDDFLKEIAENLLGKKGFDGALSEEEMEVQMHTIRALNEIVLPKRPIDKLPKLLSGVSEVPSEVPTSALPEQVSANVLVALRRLKKAHAASQAKLESTNGANELASAHMELVGRELGKIFCEVKAACSDGQIFFETEQKVKTVATTQGPKVARSEAASEFSTNLLCLAGVAVIHLCSTLM